MGYRTLNYIACVLLLQPAVVVAIEQTPSSPRRADVEVTSTGSVASSSWEQSQTESDHGLMRSGKSATELSQSATEEKKLRKNEEDVQGRSMFEEEEEDEERVAEKITRFRGGKGKGGGEEIDAVFGELGDNKCPDGYEPVIDEASCAMAAGVLETDYYKKDCNDCTGAQQWIAALKFSGGNSSVCVGKHCKSGKCRGMGMAKRHGSGSKFVCLAVEVPEEEEEAPGGAGERRTGKGEGGETDSENETAIQQQLRADLATTEARLQAVEQKMKEAGLELPYVKPEGEGEETAVPEEGEENEVPEEGEETADPEEGGEGRRNGKGR